MDNLASLYTSTAGRIGRQQWWIGSIIIAVIYFILALFILPVLGLGLNPAEVAAAANDPSLLAQVVTNGVSRAAWGSLILFAIFAYPIYAIGVKRRHDRDNNGIDVLIFIVLNLLSFLLQALGLTMGVMTVANVTVPTPNALGWVLSVGVGLLGIYLLVVLGFLRGTVGSNRYGPDPLGGAAVTA